MKIQVNKWHALPFSLLISLAACNNNTSDTTTSKDSSTTSASNADTGAAMHNDSTANKANDQQFVSDVVAGNLGEIKIAQLAQKKAVNKDVKDLAKMLEKDHTNLLSELKSYASSKNINVPTEENQDAKDKYAEFEKKSGKEFDKDWCDLMEKKHKDGISKFESEANDNNADPNLKSLVNKALPTLRTHLDHVMQCKNKLK